MAQLKAVVFSIRNVFFDEENRKFNQQQIEDVIKLIKHLDSKNIKVILHSNDRWYMRSDNSLTIAQNLSQITGIDIAYYNTQAYPSMPRKPKTDSINFILANEKLSPNEIIYVGCNQNDWRVAINAKTLFVKANWIKREEDIPYGISFDDMPALARFIDICCIQANQNDLISYKDEYIEYYTLSPFSTYKPAFGAYSASARSTAKRLTDEAEPDFWLMLLIAKIYFSGLYLEIDKIIAFPGHKVGYGNSVMDKALDAFGKCLRITYLHNALIRHTESIKSQNARNQGNAQVLGIYNHLNTLHLNKKPSKYGAERPFTTNQYKDKTILLIDDIATAGFSLDAGSLLLKGAGVKRVICFSWLKTINTAFKISRQQLPNNYPVFSPVDNANSLYPSPNIFNINYHSIISSSYMGDEMSKLFDCFKSWEWDFG